MQASVLFARVEDVLGHLLAREACGAAIVLTVLVLTYVLSAVVPGTKALGYALRHDTGAPHEHTLNGLTVLLLIVGAAVAAVREGVLPGDALVELFWPALRASCAVGFGLSVYFYMRGLRLAAAGLIDRRASCPTYNASASITNVASPQKLAASPRHRSSTPRRRRRSASQRRPRPIVPSSQKPVTAPDTSEFDGRSAVAHFYCGLSEFNPLGPLGVDVKMWLYLYGATQLQLNLLSAIYAAVHSGAVGYDVVAYCACLSFFIVEYVWHEEVHLYTYDLFRERIGLKLVWGCVCFYPYFYCIGVWPLLRSEATATEPMSAGLATCIVLLFLFGWVLTRGANLQKFAVKAGRPFGCARMTTLPGSRGRILVSGWWGVARHVNYLGEIIQAVALALPAWVATGSYMPWLYPLYYVLLFVPRALDDDAQCRAKYGDRLWGEYVRRVPWLIVPGVW